MSDTLLEEIIEQLQRIDSSLTFIRAHIETNQSFSLLNFIFIVLNFITTTLWLVVVGVLVYLLIKRTGVTNTSAHNEEIPLLEQEE